MPRFGPRFRPGPRFAPRRAWRPRRPIVVAPAYPWWGWPYVIETFPQKSLEEIADEVLAEMELDPRG